MANYTFSDPIKTQKGGVVIPITSKRGSDVTWLLDQETTVPWAPSNLSDPESTRLNMCFHPTEQIESLCEALDKWALS